LARRPVRRRLSDADRSVGRFFSGALDRFGIRPFRGRVFATWLLTGTLASILLFTLFSIFVYWVYAHDLKTPEEAIAEASGTSVALDRSGQTELHQYADPLGGLRHPVPLSEISPYLVAATVATEDPSFYNNPGVNFRGLVRAAVENLTPFGPGLFKGSGGSSITQQLAKNIYLDADERTSRDPRRKMKETVIALELKRKYEDSEILEWYLNQIYYGNYAYGAEVAAQSYFGKSAKDVTLAEAALLAGLPQSPNEYTPSNPENVERAKGRQLAVLDLMAEHSGDVAGIVQLTPEQIEAAKAEPLNYVETKFRIEAPHFVFFVEDQVRKMCYAGQFEPPNDISCEDVVGQGGLRITTTLDLALNKIGEGVIEENIAANEEQYQGHNGSLVAISPATGEILAYVGSRSFWRSDISGQVDIASSLRSHGSAMKVFSYLEAFRQGWVPSTHMQDDPLLVDAGGSQRPINNWNGRHLGKITVRRALAESVNTVAVRTVTEVGIDKMRETAHRLGINDLRSDDCGATITLGACEVKLVDMTYAFSTFATNGIMRGRPTSEETPDGFRELDPVSVLKIEDSAGNVIYEFKTPEERGVEDPAYSYMVTDILANDAIKWSSLTLDRPAASKTGTSEDFRDNVVMGYTPDIAAGVWMGNADNTPMAPGTFSSAGTGPMWKEFMLRAHEHFQLPPRNFERPKDITVAKCAGKDEIFKANQKPSKPGACAGPGSEPRSTPPPETPPPATLEPTPEPTAAPTRPPEPTETPRPEPTSTPTPEPSPTATPKPTATSPPGGFSVPTP
jgi:membrane peptidoglycan carboxypeptidase